MPSGVPAHGDIKKEEGGEGMSEKTASGGSGYITGLLAGLVVGGGLFWITMQLLIAQRP